MDRIPFKPADILLPASDFEKWSVIACDQFTSDRKYWDETQNIVGNANSTLKITLPEIFLEDGDTEERIASINAEMYRYLDEGLFTEYKDAVIYIERTQPDGHVRQGIIGAVDLEAYDYHKGSKTLIRATEGTVLERIPPRVKIRKDAPLELPHIMLLIDDINKTVIEPLANKKDKFTKLYDFDLMMGGGHITGYLVDKEGVEAIEKALSRLCGGEESPLLFAVGDGNHSLATAKECYELNKKLCTNYKDHPSRYALAEIGNIHSPALDFEPIYRVMFGVDPENVLNKLRDYLDNIQSLVILNKVRALSMLKSELGEKEVSLEELKSLLTKTSYNSKINYSYNNKKGIIDAYIPEDMIITGVIQKFIDLYLKEHTEAKVDYIHGVEETLKLSNQPNTIGFMFTGISKDTLFNSVKSAGVLPRKTFSMGEARDKRYYNECRKIKSDIEIEIFSDKTFLTSLYLLYKEYKREYFGDLIDNEFENMLQALQRSKSPSDKDLLKKIVSSTHLFKDRKGVYHTKRKNKKTYG